MNVRTETDSLGQTKIPAEAYYGIQTARALEHFHTTGVPLASYPNMLAALALVKKAATVANLELGLLDNKTAAAIIQALDEIIEGKLLDQFPIDVFQATATSFNMNVNEVVANRSIELLGGAKGEYVLVHPNNHVNMSQSTNDVVHTAIRVVCIILGRKLCEELRLLEEALQRRSKEFADVIKLGRTCLQDAVPVTLGQEFEGYASIVDMMRESIKEEEMRLSEVNLGGTVVGTGINTPKGYRRIVLQQLSELSGCSLQGARSLFGATQNEEALAILAGKLRVLAVSLSKIASDLSLLSSGPQAGLKEINLPPLQTGSSMMPGKVNPVVPMLVNQVAFVVTGYDVAISMAIGGGQLEINANEPAIAYCLLESFKLLSSAVNIFTHKCIEGITANRDVCEAYAGASTGLATLLVPLFGYEAAAAVAREATAKKKPVVDVVVEKGLLGKQRAEDLLRPANLIGHKDIPTE